MKNFYLLFVGLLLSVTTTQASETSKQLETTENGLINRYRYAQPIQFVERGVEFFIFQNGEFDFNTHPVAFNRTRRSSINTTFGAPRVRTRGNRYYTRNVGVRNLFVNYDRYGRVKRIGSIYMRYHYRHGKVKQVGGLYLKYNRRGRLIRQYGNVKPIITHTNYGDDDIDIDFDDDFQNGHDIPATDDDDLYYYRKNGNQKKLKKDDD